MILQGLSQLPCQLLDGNPEAVLVLDEVGDVGGEVDAAAGAHLQQLPPVLQQPLLEGLQAVLQGPGRTLGTQVSRSLENTRGFL